MTFDDDYVQLNTPNGPMRATCKSLGIDWPPPEFVDLSGGPFSTPRYRRVRYSAITDEQRKGLTRVCRGAQYVMHDDLPPSKAPSRGRKNRGH